MGIDIGSSASKVVILKDWQRHCSRCSNSLLVQVLLVLKRAFDQALNEANITREDISIVARQTGYGRNLLLGF